MPSLRRMARTVHTSGQPIPYMYPALRELDVEVIRGDLHVVASAPGVGKSVFAINLVLKAEVPTLYLAMDGSTASMTKRVVQCYRGWTRDEALAELDIDSRESQRVLSIIDWVRWDFPDTAQMEEIRDRVAAFGEIHGEWPHLIVVDNMMDVVEEETREAYVEAEKALTALARATGAAVLVLAHSSGFYENGDEVIPLGGVMMKATKKSSVVLSLCGSAWPNQLFCSVLKNREGPKDQRGHKVRAKLFVDYERMEMS